MLQLLGLATFRGMTTSLPSTLSHESDASAFFEVLPRDLSAYRAGNTGVPYAFLFDSGLAGPRVAINALTHGNEFCGMVAVCALLDAGLRPERGSLSLSFANVAAYESFNPSAPFDSRQLVHNLNRIWSAAELNGDTRSPELDRAREMREVFDPAHALLDIHSTSQDVAPFFVYPKSTANDALVAQIGLPAVALIMPGGMQTGTPLIEYGAFGSGGAAIGLPGGGGAVVVECGQHFLAEAGRVATEVSLRFLAATGVLTAQSAQAWCNRLLGDGVWAKPLPATQRFEMLSTHVIRTPDLRWMRPLKGMEVFSLGELIGVDGEFEIRSPCDNCTVFMPLAANRPAVPGREGVYLTRPV